jgi:6-pyruvoyl-tetrahydropterin synthase
VKLEGEVMNDGYVVDFGDVKAVTKAICKRMNEYVLLPMKSDVVKIKKQGEGKIIIRLHCRGFSIFSSLNSH